MSRGVARQARWADLRKTNLDDGVSWDGKSDVSVDSVNEALRGSKIRRTGRQNQGYVVVGEHKVDALMRDTSLESHAIPVQFVPSGKLAGDEPALPRDRTCEYAFFKARNLLQGAAGDGLPRALQARGAKLLVKVMTKPGAGKELQIAVEDDDQDSIRDLVEMVPVPYSNAAKAAANRGHDVGFALQYPVDRQSRSKRSRNATVPGVRSVLVGSAGFLALTGGPDRNAELAQAVVSFLTPEGSHLPEVLTTLHGKVHKNRKRSNSAHLISAKLAAKADETLGEYVEAVASPDGGLPVFRKRAGSPERVRRGRGPMAPADVDGSCDGYKSEDAISTTFPSYNRMVPTGPANKRRCVGRGPLSTANLDKFEKQGYGYGSIRGVVQVAAMDLDRGLEARGSYFSTRGTSDPARQEAFDRMRQSRASAGAGAGAGTGVGAGLVAAAARGGAADDDGVEEIVAVRSANFDELGGRRYSRFGRYAMW